MAWTSIPNFGDSFAKTEESTHLSGAPMIEVLYGAKDGEGNPTAPARDADDGHGVWLALEIDGAYQMFTWKHPASEGGTLEYGRGRSGGAPDGSDPLAALEADIAAKEAICAQADELSQSEEWVATASKLNQLFDDWKLIHNWRTPKEQELWERFYAARKSFYERRDSSRLNSKTEKQAIIAEARELSASSDWKVASQRFNELFDCWKSAGSAGRGEDDALWEEFNAARRTFFDRRSQHFDELDEQRAKSRELKRALIEEARSVAENSTEWQKTGDKLHEMMDRWKAAGSAGKHDEALWNQFNGIRQTFFERRHVFYDEQERLIQEHAARKSEIVREAAEIAARNDFSAQTTERMRELDREWKGVGFAGRANEETLWRSFREAKDAFWAGKHADSEQRQQEWRAKLEEAISRKSEQIENLNRQISELQDKMEGMRNQQYLDNMTRWIAEKQNKIHDLQLSIQDMKSKL